MTNGATLVNIAAGRRFEDLQTDTPATPAKYSTTKMNTKYRDMIQLSQQFRTEAQHMLTKH